MHLCRSYRQVQEAINPPTSEMVNKQGLWELFKKK